MIAFEAVGFGVPLYKIYVNVKNTAIASIKEYLICVCLLMLGKAMYAISNGTHLMIVAYLSHIERDFVNTPKVVSLLNNVIFLDIVIKILHYYVVVKF